MMESNWQPIETAPKDGTVILGFEPFDDGGYLVFSTSWSGSSWELLINDPDHFHQGWPAYWMPMLPLPTAALL